ncbi:GNAT family N-acetyltransferase [Brevundimonas sp.]|uniref:GNAT family N-acetyltransferase n=1 Tax=Brevundimonas sp. TaxID=1871086 RepID=UPI003BAA83B8
MSQTSPIGPTLETPRLILRPPAVEDFPRWAAFNAEEETVRFIGGVQAPAATWRIMMAMAGMWALTGEGMFSVIEKETSLWIGRIGPLHPYGWPGKEVGWSLMAEAHGKGYALEAAAATIDYAFDALEWADVIHCIAPANDASAGLARRLGSTNRGPQTMPAPFEGVVVDIWGQSKAEWAQNRKAFVD